MRECDILAFGAHPDDIDFGCGAILAKMGAKGASIVMVDLTAGEKGSNGTVEGRREEAQNAAEVIGAERICLEFPDCQVFDTYSSRCELVKVIRTYRPKLILSMLSTKGMNHPDHIALGSMSRYACRYSRFKKILPELPIHVPQGILHYGGPQGELPDFIIDVSSHVEAWKKMIYSHESQLKTFDYLNWQLNHAKRLGDLIGVSYAQGLYKENPIVIDDLLTIAQGIREI